jgi:chromate transporter
MNHDGDGLLTLATTFLVLSLFAVGGALSALPEMHRVAVETQHWMTNGEFADMVAIAQLSPGPNVLVVTLIGYHVAGVLGAVVAMLAMCGPTGVAAYFVGRASERFKGQTWHGAVSRGIVPVTIGLIAASATVIATTADYSWSAAAITLATAIICYFARFNPLWVFAAAALLGLAGLA